MALCPFADQNYMVKSPRTRSKSPVRLVLHTAWPGPLGPLYTGEQLIKNKSYAHFYIDKLGRLYQHCDTAYASGADVDGNNDSISVETWDGKVEQVLNQAQCETLIRLWKWAQAAHPEIPDRMATVNDLRGFAWHRLGCVGNFPEYNPDDNTTWTGRDTGVRWSTVPGKTCPLDAKIRQIPALVATARIQKNFELAAKAVMEALEDYRKSPEFLSKMIMDALFGKRPPSKPASKIGHFNPSSSADGLPRNKRNGKVMWYSGLIDGVWGPLSVSGLQRALAAEGRYTREIDGDFGPYTVKAWQGWLRDQGLYKREVDGQFGPYTVKAIQQAMRQRGLYGTDYLIDGDFGPYTIKAVQNWLARNY